MSAPLPPFARRSTALSPSATLAAAARAASLRAEGVEAHHVPAGVNALRRAGRAVAGSHARG